MTIISLINCTISFVIEICLIFQFSNSSISKQSVDLKFVCRMNHQEIQIKKGKISKREVNKQKQIVEFYIGSN